ncbi:DUF3727 domain-containing protein [Kamptonema cortianum]|uniref:DUF3727 domain-containing protein n=1 Tax=Geitlerinema calcuttense NRMC-F 0142 TaxID=2922238 RepID=A0ABT7LWX7_9CYAN|nr:DUF3727 domain-containing protein [Geitlerinema calcuttense]MCD8487405.1 DUF3727 domain-containing protein [Desertifilum sp.]MDI9640311.1 DUF3727 domain-containing protein [Geitlerinema splendidum]MDK3159176.1 DUF3727 domain-containing protein [Kamptonema cortianum]MDL5056279.1 DUF3727 domain-containing protein [Geitlerinema calcuttense NRMC-F 0142]
MDDDNLDVDTPTVTVIDEAGRQLVCYVEHSLEVDNQDYALLLPVDTPVEIFAWLEDREAPTPVDSDEEIDRLFDLAKAVLAEQNLTLKRTAVTLTVVGEIPDLDLEEEEEEEIDNEDEEEFQSLASFYYDRQEYEIFAPLDPMFILARMNEDGEPELLSVEELQRLEPLLPQIEDQLFEALE